MGLRLLSLPVRDALLGRQGYDIDITVEGNALALTRQMADYLGGAYVPLDTERDVGRVVLRVEGGQYHVDFAALRAEDIIRDLWARDYTINAMAIPLTDGLGELLDPTGGYEDLRAGVLRVASERAFEDDPLRILRGIRLRGVLSFALTDETEALIKDWLPALRFVSAERIRDELAQILALEDAAASLRYAADLGVLQTVLPEFSEQRVSPAEGIGVVQALESIWRLAREEHGNLTDSSWELVGAMRPYLPYLTEHWAGELSVGRARQVALKLAALLSVLPNAAQVAGEVARRLRLSAAEMRFARHAIEGSDQVLALCHANLPDSLEVHRYYRKMGDAGLDGVILALAWQRAGRTDCEDVVHLAAIAGRLWQAWFTEYERVVDPSPLLSGRDLIREASVKRGPLVGQMLDVLREAQVRGLVSTRDEALAYVRAYLESHAPADALRG